MTKLLFLDEYDAYFYKWKSWFLKSAKYMGPKSIVTIYKWARTFETYRVKHIFSRTRRLRVFLSV